MNYWLFQSNNKKHPDDEFLRDLNEGKLDWHPNRFKEEFRNGDRVVLNRSGDPPKERGVYAIATVTGRSDEPDRGLKLELTINHKWLPPSKRLQPEDIPGLPIGQNHQGGENRLAEDPSKAEVLFKDVETEIRKRTQGTSREGEPMEVREDKPKPPDLRSMNPKKYPSKNIILYGPPGTGKTHGLTKYKEDFGSKDAKNEAKRWEFITFHQSYSYEDFIEGIKPGVKPEDEPEKKGDGQLAYEVRNGIFKEFAIRANENRNENYVLFIDEINRGNVASIFGELITLIEEDKRLGKENAITVKLPYSHNENEQFGVPQNLYIIGTMNTADRSVEALDTALRRRFSFIEMLPDLKVLEEKGPKEAELSGINVVTLLKTMNDRIERLLDRDHCIGHAYFIDVKDLDDLRCAFANKIIPLLKEYFYGSPEKVGMVLGEAFVRQKEDKQEEKKTHFAKGKWGDDEPDEKKVYEFTEASTWQETHFKAIYL
jgi:hypothetical protein